MYYFAYGSNMSSRRLWQRLGSARAVAVARLPRHRLCWHKQGRDGSGKCDAAHTGDPGHAVLGVLYDVAAAQRALLDCVEGVGAGYEAIDVGLLLDTGSSVAAFTYRATLIDADTLPFHWYKTHVLRGAREHGLPEEYIARLEAVPSRDDPDRERQRRELLIYQPGALG
jgi:hypothetical protein